MLQRLLGCDLRHPAKHTVLSSVSWGIVQGSKSLKQRLPAGIVDASFASLATFAVGLSAVNLLPADERGVYAVFFTTFMLGTVIPRNLVFTTAEVEAVGYPEHERIPLISRTIRIGLVPAVIGATASVLAALVTSSLTTADVIVPFTLTTAVAATLSPLQDHVRKMLHIGSESWKAAGISIVQFVSTVSAILIMVWTDVLVPWIPFGSLALANLASLTFGWYLTRGAHRTAVPTDRLRFSYLARRGRWLVLQAAAPALAGFFAATIITRLASPEALGYAESARIVAQPILVLATGLTAVLAPRIVSASMNHDLPLANRTNKVYLGAIAMAGLSYFLIAGWDWALNPMPFFVPSAYEVSGLVALTIVGNMMTAAIYLQVNEILGAKKETALARLSWSVSPIVLLGAATAGTTEAFARPLGRVFASVTQFVAQRAIIAKHYEESATVAKSTKSS